VYDAFGPERIFWATDITRMRQSYQDIAAMFTAGIDWLSESDKRLIMGDAVCNWLGWEPQKA
jgi:predicted TIM-barrel fold metal-dependent hydrolase